jgi:hypothetical protein
MTKASLRKCFFSLLFILAVFAVSFWLTGCDGGKSSDDQDSKTHNYIIYIDLSKRLLEPEQVENDKKIVLDILSTLIDRAKKIVVDHDKDFSSLKDKITVIVTPKHAFGTYLNDFESKLSLDFEKIDKRAVNYYFSQSYEDFYLETLNELYGLSEKTDAIASGSEIWDFFSNKLEDKMLTGADVQNYLFILSDGYVYSHEGAQGIGNRFASVDFMKQLTGKDWEAKFVKDDYGLIPTNKDFPMLSVMLLEFKPQDYATNEAAILEKVWLKWMDEMSIENIRISRSSNAARVRQDLVEFLDAPKIVADYQLAYQEEPASTQIQLETQAPLAEDDLSQASDIETKAVVPPPSNLNTKPEETTASDKPATNNPQKDTKPKEPVKLQQPAQVSPVEKKVAQTAPPKETSKPKEAPTKPNETYLPIEVKVSDFTQDLNVISDRNQDSGLKRKLTEKILETCYSPDIMVELFSESNVLVDRYNIKDYLSRINLLGKYKVEVIELKKNENNRVTQVRVKESRI